MIYTFMQARFAVLRQAVDPFKPVARNSKEGERGCFCFQSLEEAQACSDHDEQRRAAEAERFLRLEERNMIFQLPSAKWGRDTVSLNWSDFPGAHELISPVVFEELPLENIK